MYEWVHIYVFEGDLREQIFPLKEDEDYIGFWQEANY